MDFKVNIKAVLLVDTSLEGTLLSRRAIIESPIAIVITVIGKVILETSVTNFMTILMTTKTRRKGENLRIMVAM